jgi:molybdopterin-biosynthesis enzyme MoeA-like protein
MNFYALIIGTEILNGRREDKHFVFLRDELAKYGHELFASFILKDDVELISNTFKMIQADPNAIMFSFGGIGSTPDDLTREISAKVFTDVPLVRHREFEQNIIDKFGDKAYPHRIQMSNLPQGAALLFNPVNNMSGYSLEQRYFFVPGFPQMAHPMLKDVIAKQFSVSKKKFRQTLLAQTSENTLISLMQKLPNDIELSSLPIFKNGIASVELSLSGYSEQNVTLSFELFKTELQKKKVDYIENYKRQ